MVLSTIVSVHFNSDKDSHASQQLFKILLHFLFLGYLVVFVFSVNEIKASAFAWNNCMAISTSSLIVHRYVADCSLVFKTLAVGPAFSDRAPGCRVTEPSGTFTLGSASNLALNPKSISSQFWVKSHQIGETNVSMDNTCLMNAMKRGKNLLPDPFRGGVLALHLNGSPFLFHDNDTTILRNVVVRVYDSMLLNQIESVRIVIVRKGIDFPPRVSRIICESSPFSAK